MVASEVATITPTANSAARRWFLSSIAPASTVVSTVMPTCANATSIQPQRLPQPALVDRPALQRVAALVEVAGAAPSRG